MKKSLPEERLFIKKGLLYLCGLLLLLIPEIIFAQTATGSITIKGKVTDPASGQGIAGVSVVIKGAAQTGPAQACGAFRDNCEEI